MNNNIEFLNEKLYSIETSYKAFMNYIDYINDRLSKNEQLYLKGQITKREYTSSKHRLQNERSKLSDELKKKHKQAFYVRIEIDKAMINMCDM
jgi:hypothetical protein